MEEVKYYESLAQAPHEVLRFLIYARYEFACQPSCHDQLMITNNHECVAFFDETGVVRGISLFSEYYQPHKKFICFSFVQEECRKQGVYGMMIDAIYDNMPTNAVGEKILIRGVHKDNSVMHETMKALGAKKVYDLYEQKRTEVK
jgi:hypothetical protein